MSANNKEPETISLCDIVDDLLHDESEINEDQNNVDFSLHAIGIQNHILIWYLKTILCTWSYMCQCQFSPTVNDNCNISVKFSN